MKPLPKNIAPYCFLLFLAGSFVLWMGGCAAAPDTLAALPESSTDRVASVQDQTQVKSAHLFDEGYAAFENGNYHEASARFFAYMTANSQDVDDHDWAQFFLGVSLRKMGYTHAAADILADLIVRKPNTRIVSYCLEIFEEMTRTVPYDRELIIHQVLCDQAYGFVDTALSDFVHYHQGVYDWENGFHHWGEQHFSRITTDSYYFYKALYQKTLLQVHRNQIDAALETMERIINGKCENANLLDDTRKVMARLLYEKGDYARADQLYLEIEESILAQSQNLLERAWAHYRLGNPERAMGLLYAFEAPSFQNHFSPEYYILKSFIYKDVCHYQAAMSVVQEFKSRYGDALKAIYQRENFSENDTLLLMLLNKSAIEKTWRFMELLEREQQQLEKVEPGPFRRYLKNLYALQIQESTHILKTQVSEAYEAYADKMLKYEEEAHLMAYEIGIDMYQRVQQYHFEEKRSQEKQPLVQVAVYPFQGEFWNDELADYKVVLPNKCDNIEAWDIYFK